MTHVGGLAGSVKRQYGISTLHRQAPLTRKLVHLPAEQDLRLHLAVLDGILVKILQNDAAARYLALTRWFGWRFLRPVGSF